MNILVQKFGGTSMGTADSIRQCASIVADAAKQANPVVTVSAMGGITDELIALMELAIKQKPKLISGRLNAIEKRHQSALKEFCEAEEFESIWEDQFEPHFQKLRIILKGLSYVGDATDKSRVLVSSFGEQISSRLMIYALREQGLNAQRVDAMRVIRTDSQYLEADVDFKRTKLACKRVLAPLIRKKVVPVVPGFIGKDTHGDMTLLGRGGTDYTASILAICLSGKEVQIWTDVDGIMSADPRLIKNVKVWSEVELPVMAEMSYSGAKVLHPKTIHAAVEQHIPVVIKNTFNPTGKGTRVMLPNEQKKGSWVRGIVVDADQMMFCVRDPIMLQALGFISKLTGIIFNNHQVSIDACATSEISFSTSISQKDYSKKLEKDLNKMAATYTHRDLAKVCVIGHEIGCDPAIIAKIFSTLKGYKVYATTIDSSFYNITFFVEQAKAKDVLRLLHKTLFE